MYVERYLEIDVGGTAIKYILTDRSAEICKVHEMKTYRTEEELFNSLDDIIAPDLNDINGIEFSFLGKINVSKGIAHTVGVFDWICDWRKINSLRKILPTSMD